MRIRVATLIVLALSLPASAQKSNAPADPLASAKSIRCTFPNYAAVKWNGTVGEVLGGGVGRQVAVAAHASVLPLAVPRRTRGPAPSPARPAPRTRRTKRFTL